jgi:t-SNARE complex subunit (syntaxin)
MKRILLYFVIRNARHQKLLKIKVSTADFLYLFNNKSTSLILKSEKYLIAKVIVEFRQNTKMPP